MTLFAYFFYCAFLGAWVNRADTGVSEITDSVTEWWYCLPTNTCVKASQCLRKRQSSTCTTTAGFGIECNSSCLACMHGMAGPLGAIGNYRKDGMPRKRRRTKLGPSQQPSPGAMCTATAAAAAGSSTCAASKASPVRPATLSGASMCWMLRCMLVPMCLIGSATIGIGRMGTRWLIESTKIANWSQGNSKPPCPRVPRMSRTLLMLLLLSTWFRSSPPAASGCSQSTA